MEHKFLITGVTVFVEDTMMDFGIVHYSSKILAVMALDKTQNPILFEKGLNDIMNKVTPKKREFLKGLISDLMLEDNGVAKKLMTGNEDLIEKDELIDIIKKSKNKHRLIAFVCDIALHSNKKLAHPDAYHKAFNKYVDNLFEVYRLKGSFNNWLNGGDIIIPYTFV